MLTRPTFSTSDLWVAAYFLSKGIRLMGTSRSDGKMIFEFADVNRCEEARREFLNGGQADVGQLRSAWNSLKTLIHETRHSPRTE